MLLTPKLYRFIHKNYLNELDKSTVQEVGEFETYLCDELKRINDLRCRIQQQKNAIAHNDKVTESMRDELKRMWKEECPHYMVTVDSCYEDKIVTCDLCGAEL